MSLTEEEKKTRKIGGSMIAKILKKSKWGTPLDAYLELTDERPSEEKTGEDIDRGNFLEPALREWASKKEGTLFRKPLPGTVTLAEWSWATVSPDGLAIGPGMLQIAPDLSVSAKVLLEIKAPRRDDISQWGEEGSDEVPTDALLQTHWGMMVTEADRGVVASLLGGELRIYRVARDRDLEAKMLARAKQFVEQHVIPRIPPPAEYGDDANVLYLHPRNTKEHRKWDDLTPAEKTVILDYLIVYAKAKELEKVVNGWEPTIKELIGDTSGVILPPEIGSRIDWKLDASGGTKWKDLALHLLSATTESEPERAAMVAQFPGTPKRPLKPWLKK